VSIGYGKALKTAKCKKLGQYKNIVNFLMKDPSVTLIPLYTPDKKIASNFVTSIIICWSLC
jgi:hypothetical protein